MAWPTTAADTDTFRSDGSGTTYTLSLDTTAGDLIVLGPTWEGSSSDTTVSASDGVNTYTDHFVGAHAVASAAGEPWTTLLSAVAASTTTHTITITLGAALTWREANGATIHPDAAGTIS